LACSQKARVKFNVFLRETGWFLLTTHQSNRLLET